MGDSVSAAELANAVALLQAGELVGMPTETVYGLAADASNPAAVAKIFAAKGRPANHPLIVHIASVEQLPRWATDIPPAALRLAAAFWPGPLTMILPRHPDCPTAVTGGQDTVGVRVPGHPLALALLQAFAQVGSGAVAAPSANRFGRISPTTAAHVREELGDKVQLVLDGGPCQVGIESTIVDLSRGEGEPVILRPGAITAEQIAAVLSAHVVQGDKATSSDEQNTPRVSGSLDAHYAPLTPTRLLDHAALMRSVSAFQAAGKPCAVYAFEPCPTALNAALGAASDVLLVWKQASKQPDIYARDLYAALRELDHSGAEQIFIQALPETDDWLAVADRLKRAAYGAGAIMK